MSDTIKIGSFDISSFKVGSSDCKIYLGDTLLYPTTPVQEPCYAVVDNISQYSDTEFEDVYDKATEKWYKLNNLNQYEEYGVYGSGRNITYYDGKLTIDDGYEYQYSSNTWVNVGEVSGSSRVPQGYTEVEYVEDSGTQYINTNAYLNTSNFEIGYTIIGNKQLFGYCHQGQTSGTWLGVEQSGLLFFGTNGNMVNISSYLTSGENAIIFTQNGATVNSNSISKTLNMGTDNISNTPLIVFARYNFATNSIEFRSDSYTKLKSFYLKNNGTLVRDFVPTKRDSDDKYGMYDLITDTFYVSPNGNNFAGGSPTTGTTVYPIYYDEMQDPLDNVTFTSMTEAESYQCPWWGMTGIIDNTDYMFCEGNEWLTKYVYQEVSGEYICDNGDKYKKMQEYDRIADGTTTATTNYEKGDLIESGSSDCQKIDYSTQYLTFVAETDNVSFVYSTATSSNKLKYSTDSGSTWNDLSNGSSTSSINNGDRIMFKASGLTVNTERGIGKIIPSASASVEGNIMSLVYGDNFSGQTAISNNLQFRRLFSGATNIISAENMVIPATSLRKMCYSSMFHNCTNMTTPPKKIGDSAMTYNGGDYIMSDMFNGCSSLTTAPELPATNLTTACYWFMFQGCTSLTKSPILPATSSASQCYNGMFYGCTSLNTVTCLLSTATRFNDWLINVSSNGTFYKNPNASWSRGTNAVPTNWTIINYTS